mmetsp:Transcript_11059/g.22615  ORF Transcript_11059/g.22615 Transcript_11059/m.22615 type:complete len:132 (+) Transcript_11059:1319-1714(+)
MEPVEPRMEMRFWKAAPSRALARVFLREAAVLTGAEGSIHPAPVPREPGMGLEEEEEWRSVVDCLEALGRDDKEEKAVAEWRRRRPLRAMEGTFMVAGRCRLPVMVGEIDKSKSNCDIRRWWKGQLPRLLL